MKKFLSTILVITTGFTSAIAADIFVSPTGNDSNSGSLNAPFLTIKKAIETAKAGTTIYLREGTYTPTNNEIMKKGVESAYDCVYNLSVKGTADKPITITGYNDEKVIIDLSQIKTDTRIIGFYVKADYWHLKKFDITGIQVTQTGHTQSINVGLFGGSNCIIEQVNMHDGMGIGVYATRGSNNLVLNCDAYNNYDPVSENGAGGNCDGFGFHLNNVAYTGNVISGCRAWRNSDDGYDLINNQAPVVIENCWAWENGYDANRVSRGDGTGFKSGGYGMNSSVKTGATIPRNIVRNCLSWSNKQAGFYANHHLGGLDFTNNTSYHNKRNFNMVNRKSATEAVDVDGYDHSLTNNVAYQPILTDANCVNLDQSLSTATNNTFMPEMTLTDTDFESLDANQLLLPRKADGSLPEITFMRLKTTSAAYKAGMGYQFPYNNQTSGIEKLEVDVISHSISPYFNLQGISVNKPKKGLYVHNGKKVLFR
ncbi:MAG: right-handed parallel beta-helix repeat-containing protein [Muribaculum sp.]|nr:right-handed parallel beta-helix repeat-containing protein [Muribaculaceae bacterium]MCM1080335.1 right-handed parallel beta-helix repeat-containing protein [Muribaculum sp.]